MTNYQRITAKVFGETATATGNNPEIGQFGSALAGTYVGTTDIATIQNLVAWSNGFIGCVTPTDQFPPLPELTGFGKVLSQQQAYLLQKGMPEWDAGTIYYINDLCKGINLNNEICIYKSKVDNNYNNALSDTNYWLEIPIEEFTNKQTIGDWCITTPTTTSSATINKPAVIKENYKISNNLGGYYVRTDNFCMQWGIYNGTGGNLSNHTINLYKDYGNTNYSVTATSESGKFIIGCYPSTKTQIIYKSRYYDDDMGSHTETFKVYWMTRGYIT